MPLLVGTGERVEEIRRKVTEVQNRLHILQNEKESKKGISEMKERGKEKENHKKTNGMLKDTKRKREMKIGRGNMVEGRATVRASQEKVVINVGGVKHEVGCLCYEKTWI